jgi:FAD:protein FMN transferase
MFNKPFLKLLLIVLVFLSLLSCSDNRTLKDRRLLMNTTVEITVEGKDRKDLREAVNEAFYHIEKVNQLMNYYDQKSGLSALNNKAEEEPIKVDEELYYIIDKCLKFGKITEGSFDITATSLGRLNGYKSIELDSARKTVYFKDSGTKIDLSAAAKGYAVDKAVSSLKGQGVERALVNAGGDLRAIGRDKEDKWMVGLRNPKDKDKIILTLKISNKAVATSGDYFRDHIIKTKKDKKSIKVLSSTIIADDCLTADILATSLFVMGEEGIELIERIENAEGLLIIEENKKLEFIESSGFKNYYN